MEAIKAIDGRKDHKIDELGCAMANLFSKRYSYMSEEDQIKTFFSAVQMYAHTISGYCRQQHENDDLLRFIELEAKHTVDLAKEFLA